MMLDRSQRMAMEDEVHIRDAETARLVRELARRTGRSIGEVLLDALRQYRPNGGAPAQRERAERWRRLLREDRERGMTEPEIPIEALYDDATGLPK